MMNFFKKIGLTFNKNNYKYIKKEIEKSNDKNYITELINKMNPSLIDLELIKLATKKEYEFNSNSPKELLNNKDIVLYALHYLYNKSYFDINRNITFIINNAEPNIIPIDLIIEYFDNDRYYIESNIPSYLSNNIEFVKYCLKKSANRGDVYNLLHAIDNSIFNDELVDILIGDRKYSLNYFSPEFLKLNSKYLAYSFVKFELDDNPRMKFQYDSVLDDLKLYFDSIVIYNDENDNKFNLLNKDEILNYIDKFVIEMIDNSIDIFDINFGSNLIRYNKKYIVHIIDKMKDKIFSEYELNVFFGSINKSIIDIDLLKKFISLGLKYFLIPDKFKENPEIISEYIAKGDINSFVDFSENTLLSKYNNTSLLDNMLKSDILPVFIYNGINSLETLNVLEKHNRYDLFYHADLKLLMDYPDKENNYMSKLIELYKQGIDVNFQMKTYKYDNKEIMGRCYIEMTKAGLNGFLDDLTEKDLLEKTNGNNLLYYLIKYDKDITINEILNVNLKSNPKIATELKFLGVDNSMYFLSNVEYKPYECDKLCREMYNQEYCNNFQSPVEELLEEFRQLFLNDGKSDSEIVEALITSYRFLTNTDSIFIEEVKMLIDIKKRNENFYYIKRNVHSLFSELEGIVVENSTISTLNHETGHALHKYLTDFEVPDNYSEILYRIINNPNFIQRVSTYSQKIYNIKSSVLQKAKEIVDKYMIPEKLDQGELIELLNKDKEIIIQYYIDKGYTRDTLEFVLLDSYTIEEFLTQKRKIQIYEVFDLIIRYDYDSFGAIGDIIDAITGGKYRSSLLKDENNEILPPTSGHGVRYYSGNIHSTFVKFTEMIANYSEIIKSKNKDKAILLLRNIVGDELVDLLDDFYKNKMLKLNTQEKTR